MRRRETGAPVNYGPIHLRRFRAEEWPAGCHPACAFYAARDEWLAQNDDGPDGHVRLTMAPEEFWPNQPWHPELI